MFKYDIFISYSRKDTIIANKICNVLDDYGITYFIDKRGIAGGMEFPMVLADAIIDSRLFLFLASYNSYDSKFTNSEITFAFNEKLRQTILPYIIDDSELPRHFRFIFSGINWRNITEHPIDTVLIDDICALLGREKIKIGVVPTKCIITQDQIKEWAELGNKYYTEENYPEAAKWYLLSAEQGDADAQYRLGIMYEYGKGVEENYPEAAKWYKLSAEQGNPDAQYQIGLMFEDIMLGYYDYTEASKWYKLAADQGHPHAQYRIASMYEDGVGVEKDIPEAIKWYRLAADQGIAAAKDALKQLNVD